MNFCVKWTCTSIPGDWHEEVLQYSFGKVPVQPVPRDGTTEASWKLIVVIR